MGQDYLLEMRDISKSFPGVKALDNVNLKVKKGTVHVLVGENGAGKSTLIKILCGLHTDYTGEMLIEGEKVSFANAKEAIDAGVATIHQELNQVQALTIAENVFLGREPKMKNGILIDDKKINQRAAELLESSNMGFGPKTLVSQLTVAQMQMIEIIKAVNTNAKIIIMDEPTSAISDKEVKVLFETIESLKAQGVTIIYISHRLDEIFQIGDAITILRDGQYIDTKTVAELDKPAIIKMMVGREINNIYPQKPDVMDESNVVFEVENLNSQGKFNDISFQVHAGEILGLAGLMGAGRTEVARAIFGLDPIDSGELYLQGEKVKIKNTSDALDHGIVMASEDRKRYGLVLKRTISDNIGLPNLKKFRGRFLLDKKKELSAEEKVFKQLGVKAPSMNVETSALSGGNQQKVVLAKWILADPKVFILDEPTRGIDVGAKYEIYKIMIELAAKGMAIIMISSELPEVIGICDRVIIMREHHITGELNREELTQEAIMNFATADIV